MISQKIRDLLKQKGMTIESLANQIGYSRMGLTNTLKTEDFKVSVLDKIAKALEVEISYFFDGTQNDFEETVHEFFKMNLPKQELNLFEGFLMERLYVIYYDLVNSNRKLFNLLEPYKIVRCYTDGGDCTFVSKDNDEYSYKTPVNLIRFVEDITGEPNESLINELNLIYDDISNDFINVVYDNKMIKWFLKRDIINDRSLTKTVFDVLYAETPVISGEKVSNGAITKTYKKIKNVRNPFEK